MMSYWSLKTLESKLLIGSTLVEGSTLSESEAKQVLQGQTVQGHSVSEFRELLNYRTALEALMKDLEESPYLSEDLVLAFHQRLFAGMALEGGRYKSELNFTYLQDGTKHSFMHPAQVKDAILDWIATFNTRPRVDAAEAAARTYLSFEEIHPFEDGNGRVGRVLASYYLHWHFDLGFEFYVKDKILHLEALQRANRDEMEPLIQFFEMRLLR